MTAVYVLAPLVPRLTVTVLVPEFMVMIAGLSEVATPPTVSENLHEFQVVLGLMTPNCSLYPVVWFVGDPTNDPVGV